MAHNMLCYLLLVVVASTWLSVTADEIYTPAMMKKIALLDEWIDDTVNPCDDFQKYLCSKVDNDIIGSAYYFNAKLVADIHLEKLNNSDDATVKKAFNYYNICTNGIEKRNETIKLILADLDNIFKDENGNYQKFDAALIAKVSAYLSVRIGLSVFNAFVVRKPFIKPDWYSQGDIIFEIMQPELSQPSARYNPAILSSQAEFIKEGLRDAYVYFEPTKSEAEVNATLLEFFYFETNITSLFQFPATDYRTLCLTNPYTTPPKASEDFPFTDWKQFITLLSNYSGADLLKRFTLENYPMQFLHPKVTKGLPDIIAKTPDELLRNYIRVLVVRQLLAELHEENCLSLTWQTFPVVKQYLYLIKRYPTVEERQNIKSSVTKLADNVISHVQSMMEKVSWMKNDNQTFAGFTEKINKMRKTIAFHDHLANQTWRDEYHKDIVINENDTLYSLYLKGKKFFLRKANFKMIDEVNPVMDITNGNAFYDPQENRYNLKLGYVFDRSYNADYAPAYNYGFLGSAIGHEIIHGFDTSGIDYDSEGFVKHWMSNNSQVSFDKMATCVVDWYSSFNLTDSKGKVWQLNGNITSGENIADNGGIRASYNAFKSDPANMQPFPRTKKLKNLTQEQLFFMGFGSYFCSPPLPDVLFEPIFNDAHPPHQFRLLGTLQNFVPFREAFNCPVNSKYAPEKHCDVYAPDIKSRFSVLLPNVVLLAVITFVNGI